MAELTRALGALALAGGLVACGAVTRGAPAAQPQGQTAPAPSTPVQKATASPANPDSAILADFNARLDKYVKFQRVLLKEAPLKETENPSEITASQEVLAAKIRNIRKNARQGDILTPQVAAMFKRLYDNPFTNAAVTFATSFPIGLAASAISAALLRKR